MKSVFLCAYYNAFVVLAYHASILTRPRHSRVSPRIVPLHSYSAKKKKKTNIESSSSFAFAFASASVSPTTRSLSTITRCSASAAVSESDEIESCDDDENDDDEAKSQFGTKEYWDGMYQGMGDFPMDEYEWYFGLERYWKHVVQSLSSRSNNNKNAEILIPGIGNDPMLLDMLQKGYTKLTATDYSGFAIERQQDLLSYQGYPFSSELLAVNDDDNNDDNDNDDHKPPRPTMLLQMDARKMPQQWTNTFDLIIEKGALDAIYLSGDGNAERAAKEFERILKPNGGILISVSGVVPADLRKEIFKDWNWIRDGSDDLEAGCFVLEKTKQR